MNTVVDFSSFACHMTDQDASRLAEELDACIMVPRRIVDYSASALRVAQASAQLPLYRQNHVENPSLLDLPAHFAEGIGISDPVRAILSRRYPSIADWDALVDAAWSACCAAKAVRFEADGVVFVLPLPMCEAPRRGAELYVRRTQDRVDSCPQPYCAVYAIVGSPQAMLSHDEWEARRADSGAVSDQGGRKERIAPRFSVPSSSEASDVVAGPASSAAPSLQGKDDGLATLFSFAMFSGYPEMIRDLSCRASREDWSLPEYPFEGKPAKPYGALGCYVRASFCRGMREGRVKVSSDGAFAAFDTGLQTPFGTELYLCFTPAAAESAAPWEYCGCAEPGCGALGKRLLRAFGGDLPAGAVPFPPAMKRDQPCYADMDHIIFGRTHRLPRVLFDGYSKVGAALDAARSCSADERAYQMRRVARLMHEDRTAYAHIRRKIDDALSWSLARWSEDADMAVRIFSGNDLAPAMVLPLWLTGGDAPDVVAVVTDEEGYYQVHTLLDLARAAADIRVVGKDAPWWLDRACFAKLVPHFAASRSAAA